MKFTLCKKQYLYLALAVISMVLAVATHAFAQDAVSATNSSPDAPPNGAPIVPQSEPRAIKEARESGRLEKGIEVKATLEEPAQNRIINLARNVIGKMESAANRMAQIITRTEARIVILKGKGVDTAQAEIALGKAKDSVDQAKNLIATLDTSTLDAVSGEKPREKFQAVKSQFGVVRTTLREAHESLKTVVLLLKEAVKASELPTGASDAVQSEESLEEKTSPESTQ